MSTLNSLKFQIRSGHGTSLVGPVGKTLSFQCRGHRFHLGLGTKIPHAPWQKKKKKVISALHLTNADQYVRSPKVLKLFSHSIVSNSLQPHGLQHARLPRPSPTPRDCSNSCASSRRCHPIVSSSVVPFSCLQSFPASASFPMSQFFTSGVQNIGASVSALPMNIQDWSPLEWTGLISLPSKGLSRVFSNTTVQKRQFYGIQLCGSTLTSIDDCWKNHWNYYFYLFVYVYFWPCLMTFRIWIPRPGIKPGPLAVRTRSPNHWTTEELSLHLFFYDFIYLFLVYCIFVAEQAFL